jgi:phosphoglucosamine mutase
MISASHNQAPDNGIKFFSFGGTKLPDEVEDRIEQELRGSRLLPIGAGVGRIRRFADAEDRYVLHLLSTLDVSLAGLHVVVDCANGAAAGISPRAFKDAGAQVTVIGSDPDGLNINEGCGSTDLALLKATVIETGANLGIAHDGDADRVLLCDETGSVLDGDEIMALAAISMIHAGTLKENTLVATVMSNAGLDEAVRAAGGRVVRVGVGDRYVIEEMKKGGYNLGGEQSGHFIFRDHNTTGDGILAAVQVLVYAGAVMVVFLFVIMLLDLKADERRHINKIAVGLGGLSALAIAGTLVASIVKTVPVSQTAGRLAEGETKALGRLLFESHILPFEILSVLLLVAMVGAILITKKDLR